MECVFTFVSYLAEAFWPLEAIWTRCTVMVGLVSSFSYLLSFYTVFLFPYISALLDHFLLFNPLTHIRIAMKQDINFRRHFLRQFTCWFLNFRFDMTQHKGFHLTTTFDSETTL